MQVLKILYNVDYRGLNKINQDLLDKQYDSINAQKKINDFKENCKEKFLKIEIEKLRRAGAIVLAVLTIAGSLVIVFKIKVIKVICQKIVNFLTCS